MDESQIVRAAYSLCKALNKSSAEVLGREIADVVNKHSIGAAAAGLGVAWLPGAGSTAALAACAGVIWSMYFRINSRIGVSLSKNILKSVGTAIATNLAASVVSSVAISTVASLFPGIGNVAASAVMAGVSYSLTWASGLIYLKVLARLAGRHSDLSSVDEETLKRTAKDIMANEDIKTVLKEAKEQYKRSKERGEINKDATIDEESEEEDVDTSPIENDVAKSESFGLSRAEELILGRARRYAKAEEVAKSGMITDAQRTDLEKLASKYGIDELRLEELIDEAFA